MAVPMWLLYEIGIVLSRILLRERLAPQRREEQSASSQLNPAPAVYTLASARTPAACPGARSSVRLAHLCNIPVTNNRPPARPPGRARQRTAGWRQLDESIERDRSQPQLFGQPRGLATLFMTEMWERFTYYGMRAILILFMAARSRTAGSASTTRPPPPSTGCTSPRPILLAPPGGWIADRLIGQQRAVVWGGVLIMLGNGSLAVRRPTRLFFVGLIVIVLGVGLLKPNISASSRSSIRKAARGATPASRSSTWASTSARSSARSVVPIARRDIRLERGLRAAGARHAVRPGAVPAVRAPSRHLRARAARQAGDTWLPVVGFMISRRRGARVRSRSRAASLALNPVPHLERRRTGRWSRSPPATFAYLCLLRRPRDRSSASASSR